MGTFRLKVIGLLMAGLVMAACQNQATPSTGGQSAAGAPAGTPNAANANGVPADMPAAPTALPTRVVTASTTVAVDGELALASPLVSAAFDASAKVTAVYVKPGQSVKKGDTLAELDTTSLNTAVQNAQQSLALKQAEIEKSLAPATQTDIDVAKAALNSAYAAYNTVKNQPVASDVAAALISLNLAKNSLYSTQLSRDKACLRPNGYWNPADEAYAKTLDDCKREDMSVQSSELSLKTAEQKYADAQKPATQNELTQAWSNVVQAKTSLATLQNGATDAQKKVYDLQLQAAQVTLERAQRDLAGAKLLSPCDCEVQAVSLSAGADSSGGSITLLDTAQLKFQTTNLNERDVVKLQAGQTVTVRLKAFDQTFTGKVGAVLPVSSGTSNSVALYTALISIDPAGAALRPGMTGQAEINLS
jgi:multidrug efflux pump subunit AcrA (membrane-fusion protein)